MKVIITEYQIVNKFETKAESSLFPDAFHTVKVKRIANDSWIVELDGTHVLTENATWVYRSDTNPGLKFETSGDAIESASREVSLMAEMGREAYWDHHDSRFNSNIL